MPVRVTDRDRGWAQLIKELRAAGDLSGKAGVIGTKAAAERPDGEGGTTTNAEIALTNEFGSQDGKVPERSFIRSTFDRQRSKYETDLQKLAAKVYARQMKIEKAVGLVAAEMASDIRKTIIDGEAVPPPNAASTIASKGSSRPLVNTGQLKAAVSSAVEKKTSQE